MADKLLRVGQVVEKVGLSRTTIWRLRRQGDFPQPTVVYGPCIAWSENELDEWIKRRLQKRRPALSFR